MNVHGILNTSGLLQSLLTLQETRSIHSKNRINLLSDRGPVFQVLNLNGNLTYFRPSEIHCQPDPTERNGSLDKRQPEM